MSGGTIQNIPITPGGGILDDVQYIGKSLPACPGSNDNESFDQSLTIKVGTSTYPLTMINHISRGYFSGTAKVDVTITTP